MKPALRLSTVASTFALGLAFGLQPISIDFAAFQSGPSVALAKGDNGNGGGNGGGDGGGNEGGNRGGHGGDRGEGHGAGGEKSGHAGERGDRGDRGHKDGGTQTAHGRGGNSGHDFGRGQGSRGGNLGLIEGFLADVRGEKKGGRSSAEKSKAAEKTSGTEKSATSREAKTAATQPASTTTTTAKVSASSLGRLNAAHALANGKQPNASANSTIGLLSAYRDALLGVNAENEEDASGGKVDLQKAAEALAAIANKEVTPETIKGLNDVLGLKDDVLTESEAKELAQRVEDIRSGQSDNTAGTTPSGGGSTTVGTATSSRGGTTTTTTTTVSGTAVAQPVAVTR